MNSLRKVFGSFLAGLMLAAFASPGTAASGNNKTYTLNVSPSSLAAGVTGATVTATFANLTPIGNSTIVSLKLFAPPGITITAASIPAASGFTGIVTVRNSSGAIVPTGTPGTAVWIDSINLPIKPGGPSMPIAMTVNANLCNQGGDWGTKATPTGIEQVFTGSGWGGQTFTITTPSSVTTSITGGGCYTFTASPASVASGSGSITATFTNVSVAGGPSIGALSVNAPTGFTITGGTASNGGTVLGNGQNVQVTSGSAVAPGGTLTLTLGVTTAASCQDTGPAAWSSATVYSGSGLSGGTLNLQGAYPTTGITKQSCSVSITAPSSAAVNVPFDVKATLTGGSGGANVTLTSSCTYTGGGTIAATGFVADFSSFTLTQAGTCTITVTADAGYGSTSIASFKVYNGVLGCGDALQNISDTGGANVDGSTGLDPVTGLPVPGWAAGNRGINDKDAPCTKKVDYTFTNNVLGGNSTNLTWDVIAVSGAAFKYTINWRPEYVNGTGMPSQHTYVKWYGLNAPAAPVLGRACIAQNQDPVSKDFLPRPYGTLTAPIGLTDNPIFVASTATIPTPPFAITIGSERMMVSAIAGAGTTWTVVRGDGSTTPAAHLATAYVMSNPLPVYYPTGIASPSVQMGMCIADEGFVIVPPGANDCTTSTTPSPNLSITVPTTPTSCTVVTTTLYDIGDGSGVRAP